MTLTIKITDVPMQIQTAYRANVPVLLEGTHGIGKSSIFEQIAAIPRAKQESLDLGSDNFRYAGGIRGHDGNRISHCFQERKRRSFEQARKHKQISRPEQTRNIVTMSQKRHPLFDAVTSKHLLQMCFEISFSCPEKMYVGKIHNQMRYP